jgi:amidohydrolase
MLDRAMQINDQIVAWRRDFHKHPELGFREKRTAARVAEVLGKLGCQVRTGVGRTGVVGDLGSGSPIVAIRADMDALPVMENNPASYVSQVPGVMHACGHDAHTAMALGAATLLVHESYPGTVRFLFQPAEEIADEEGIGGAERMIEDGAMQGVDMVFALHVDSSVSVGDITLDTGANSAGMDTFYATILGRGGHGAAPEKVVDPIHIAGHVILALHSIVSRRLYPMEPAVISVGSLHSGDAANVIPNRVEISGTIRYMDNNIQKKIHEEIERALSIASAMGGDYEFELEIGNPPMFNDDGVVALINQAAVDLLGAEHVKVPRQEMGAEDFGYFAELAPGAMFYLGAKIAGDERRHHSPRFDIDERCLPIGAALLAETALRYNRSKGL